MDGNPEESADDHSLNDKTLETLTPPRACPACGTCARRVDARFCATCGKTFDDDGYLPADAIRASYHFQGRQPSAMVATTQSTRRSALNCPTSRRASAAMSGRRVSSMPFHKNQNGASTTALAFVTYALVPYLGILFCPGALWMGSIGLARAYRAPHAGGRRASMLSIVLGVVIFGAQLFLWWILYKIPDWSRHMGA